MSLNSTAVPFRGHCRPHWSLARTWLLQPGVPDDRRAFDSALDSAADVVVLDIEDGLPDDQKAGGRTAVADWLWNGGQAWVRINPAGTPQWCHDLRAIADAPGLCGIVLAKTQSAEDVVASADRHGSPVPIVALIESALGIEAALEIARSSACSRLAFGTGDFRRDTGMSAEPMALAYPRGRLVVASRAAGLPAPIDGPTLRNDARFLARDTGVTKSMGMSGRLCLDASHADPINTLLSPSDDEIELARRTIAASDPAGPYDGSVGPTLARAEAVLELAVALGVAESD